MFGTNDDAQTTMGSPTVQNPSMLDNVSAQDFQVQQDNTPQDTPPTPIVEHQITTDNPFIGDPIASPQASAQNPALSLQQPASVTPLTSTPSGPVQPPVVDQPVETAVADSSGADQAASTLPQATPITPIDHDKLAEMKRDALEHLAPLADQIDGTPEETFRTTMMMIQANDNHLLLEKALTAAKKIEDDKARAQAMLDILNEINYFSQVG